jgi:peptide/nickel transport system substrate-binding protein
MCKRISKWGLTGVLLFILFAPLAVRAMPGGIERYTIGDRQDWGFPAPYFHYPRGPGYLRMSMVFDTLIWKDARGFIPMLATGWRYDARTLRYIFDLNPRARWHDGRPVTAVDVAFTVSYMKRHPYVWIDLSRVKTARAVSRHRVVIRLLKPYAPFLEDVAGSMPILPKHVWDHATPETISRKKAAVGSGPFVLKAYHQREGAVALIRNETYYRGKPIIKTLLFRKINDPVFSFLRKDIQAGIIPPEAAPVLKKKGATIMTSPAYWVLKLLINHQRPPMKDLRFRKALLFAVNRERLVRIVLHGFGAVASLGILPPQSPWFNKNLPKIPCDPEKARRLLARVQGANRRLVLIASGRFSRVAELIREDLEKAGFKISVQTMEATAVDAMIRKGSFDLALNGHGGIGGDPKILNDVIAGDFLLSEKFIQNPKLLDLLKRNLETMDSVKRHRLVNEIQKMHAALLPSIPLYYPQMAVAHDGRISWFYTRGGISKGIPFPFNKTALVEKKTP